ncbi:MAG: hypothetical protein HWE24_21260 [Oceanospirillaceae bacterium]|nr:hypothetical protein [Oceanospirillaceae bacterium]
MGNTKQNTLPFDVLKNGELLKFSYSSDVLGKLLKEKENFKGVVKNWFIPIITEQSLMDKVLNLENEHNNGYSWYLSNESFDMFPQSKLYVEIENGELTSVEVLFNKGKKLYKVISQKDYGVVKSRMELNDKGRLVPYGKCDLIPFEGEYQEWNLQKNRRNYSSELFLSQSSNYSDGLKDGESFTYYKTGRWDELSYFKNKFKTEDYPTSFEKTTFVKGKKEGEYINTKSGVEGNYINDKRSGVWLMNNDVFSSEIYSETERDILEFFKTKEYYWSSDIGMKNQPIEVNYVNGILHGKFRTLNDSVYGNFELGKMNGVLKQHSVSHTDEDDEFVGGVDRVSQIVDGKLIGIDYGFNKHYGFNQKSILFRDEYGVKIRLGLEHRSSDEFILHSDELLNKLNHHINDETFDWIIENTNGEFKSKEDFLNRYFIYEYNEYELNYFPNGNPSGYSYSPTTSERIGNFCLKNNVSNTNNTFGNRYWSEEFLKMLVEKYDYPFFTKTESGGYSSTYKSYRESFTIPSFQTNNDVVLLQFGDTLYPNEETETIQSLKDEVFKRKIQQIINLKKVEDKEQEEREQEEERVRLILEEREKQEQLLKEQEEQREKENEKKMKKLREKQLKEEGLHITSFPMD